MMSVNHEASRISIGIQRVIKSWHGVGGVEIMRHHVSPLAYRLQFL